ncbi:hypothetical protein B0H16DRAFT_1882191 [Mycena metata]|uniref:Uncharacterized protein n=1 Tax=Mycena metata TaxID=1033252 RepID=A0AAD7NNL1_9AGAR|nr:hypothetical protein B0H16DRAFT_1882191 [Mycena metata]
MASSYEALSALGAPISLEEYTRLSTGVLGDALSFLSEHIVGRHAAATARKTVFLYQEAQAKSQLKQPATTRSRADKAVARLASAKTSSRVHSTQLADLQSKVDIASTRGDGLRSNLDDKRVLLLLLNVLEAKQNLRMKRIEALTHAIDDLRSVPSRPVGGKCSGSLDQVRKTTPNTQQRARVVIYPSLPPPPQLPRPSHTRDRLADLHVSMIRLHREALGKTSVGLKPERNRPTDRALDAKSRTVRAKSDQLQPLVNRTAALNLSCERRLASISTSTSALRQSVLEVQDCVPGLKGHVDVLRGLILAARATRQHDAEVQPFAVLVARACRMPETSSVPAILEEVERVVRRAHRRRTLLTQGQLLPPEAVPTSLMDTYRRTSQEAHTRATTLLTRKANKAGTGLSLASEVEQLVGEVRKVVGISISAKE